MSVDLLLLLLGLLLLLLLRLMRYQQCAVRLFSVFSSVILGSQGLSGRLVAHVDEVERKQGFILYGGRRSRRAVLGEEKFVKYEAKNRKKYDK